MASSSSGVSTSSGRARCSASTPRTRASRRRSRAPTSPRSSPARGRAAPATATTGWPASPPYVARAPRRRRRRPRPSRPRSPRASRRACRRARRPPSRASGQLADAAAQRRGHALLPVAAHDGLGARELHRRRDLLRDRRRARRRRGRAPGTREHRVDRVLQQGDAVERRRAAWRDRTGAPRPRRARGLRSRRRRRSPVTSWMRPARVREPPARPAAAQGDDLAHDRQRRLLRASAPRGRGRSARRGARAPRR